MRYIFLSMLVAFAMSCTVNQSEESLDQTEATLNPAEESLSPLDKELKLQQKKFDILGMSVVAIKNGEEIYSFYNGLADEERKKAITAETKYRVASISKYIVTTALMKLYEEGKFTLDEDVSKYLGFTLRNPNFPEEKITMKHLLTHSSSLTDSDQYFDFLIDTYHQKNPAITELFDGKSQYSSEDTWQKVKPGTHFEYCNLAFGIIGNVIEKLSGERFDVYVKKTLLEPIGVTGSFNVEDLENIDELSVLYRREDLDPSKKWVPQTDNHKGVRPEPRTDLENYEIGHNGVAFGPQGSFRGSAEDLAKVMKLHLQQGEWEGKQILKPETVSLMNELQWKTDDKLFKEIGLCTHITEELVKGERLYGHTGDAYGLHSMLFFDPVEQYGVVVIVNSSLVEEAPSKFYTVEEALMNSIMAHLKEELKAVGS
ncbi:serine hydrolase domain-containing protein [Sediminitomix flava]|uniref:CubicO group peptidase (Beta-lactamase class C family) n=1 Tax=Sediminitomix flava TaxID=379075 RepID=A0A315ZDE7_SEDFL|nr:serine hydrolase domain-containing protein [Sediminitomix flava]PWJ43342.1 CubicO group peptidase (beta-lactamase class C family) [Sediminitomix flava]